MLLNTIAVSSASRPKSGMVVNVVMRGGTRRGLLNLVLLRKLDKDRILINTPGRFGEPCGAKFTTPPFLDMEKV